MYYGILWDGGFAWLTGWFQCIKMQSHRCMQAFMQLWASPKRGPQLTQPKPVLSLARYLGVCPHTRISDDLQSSVMDIIVSSSDRDRLHAVAVAGCCWDGLLCGKKDMMMLSPMCLANYISTMLTATCLLLVTKPVRPFISSLRHIPTDPVLHQPQQLLSVR